MPHAVSVKDNEAKANIFSVPTGTVIPVVYGKKKNVQVSICRQAVAGIDQCLAYFPGIAAPVKITGRREKDNLIIDTDLLRGCAMLFFKAPGN